MKRKSWKLINGSRIYFIKEENNLNNEFIIDLYGNKYWYKGNQSHRDDGPAVEYIDDYGEEWWQNGNLHRENGSAISCKNFKAWLQNDKIHRLDGPALEYTDGRKFWYYQEEYLIFFSRRI